MATSDAAWEDFLRRYPRRQYKKGQIILFQGESPRYVYIVDKGIVKTYNIDYDGKEQFVNLETPGCLFPKLWAWGKEQTATYYYEALSDCQIRAIPKNEYLLFVKQRPQHLLSELDNTLSEYANNALRLNALLYTRASDKIAHILNYLAHIYAPNNHKNILDINLKLTHQHIASLTGLTRETVSVELNKFKRKGILTYKPAQYRVNMKKLREVLRKEF